LPKPVYIKAVRFKLIVVVMSVRNALLLSVLLFISGIASAVGCGDTISSSTTLTSDVTGCTDDGIIIGADDIVLDCAGHRISGSGTADGISLTDRSGVTIKNCVVSGFERGIHLMGSSSSTLASNTVYNNDFGIYLMESSDNSITGNVAYDNNQIGVYLYDGCNNNGIVNNEAYANSVTGLLVSSGSTDNTLESNTAYENKNGLYVFTSDDVALKDNTAYGNSQYGIIVQDSDGVSLEGSHLYDNKQDLRVSTAFGEAGIDASKLVFDSPAGDRTGYTTLSFSDVLNGYEGYTISWASSPGGEADKYGFADKFVEITGVSESFSIDSVTWHWLDSELTGYDESEFELWYYDAGGKPLNDNPGKHTLSQEDLQQAGVFAILEAPEPEVDQVDETPTEDGTTEVKNGFDDSVSEGGTPSLPLLLALVVIMAIVMFAMLRRKQ
jgi:parallel beta-helix repeat protein